MVGLSFLLVVANRGDLFLYRTEVQGSRRDNLIRYQLCFRCGANDLVYYDKMVAGFSYGLWSPVIFFSSWLQRAVLGLA